MHRRKFLTMGMCVPFGLAFSAVAARASSPMTFQTNGIAINGSDPVAYFKTGGPVAGSSGHQLIWAGATWRFSNAQNLSEFESDPQAFAPRFGGYCAFAAAKGALAPTVPEAWTIYEDRLYLNANLRARELWLQDIPGHIAAAEKNWPGILG